MKPQHLEDMINSLFWLDNFLTNLQIRLCCKTKHFVAVVSKMAEWEIPTFLPAQNNNDNQAAIQKPKQCWEGPRVQLGTYSSTVEQNLESDCTEKITG